MCLSHKKTLKKTRIKLYNTLALPILLYGSETRTINPLNAELNPICHLLSLLGAHHILHVSRIRVKARDARRITAAAGEIHEKNSRIHLDRLQNEYTNCKGI